MTEPRFIEGAMQPHLDNTTRCWCQPEILHPCPECPIEPGHVMPNTECWRCGGRGLVACDADDPESCDEAHVIVHNDL